MGLFCGFLFYCKNVMIILGVTAKMKQFAWGVGLTVLFALVGVPAAQADNKYLPDLTGIYWHQDPAAHSGMMLVLPDVLPMIAIVIDDAGIDVKRSARAVRNLKAPVTMSYLAYARNIREQVAAAREKGHEVILHMPWEADRPTADPGLHHLSVSMSQEQVQKNLKANLDSFEGYVGVNNHMGSKFSRHRAGLEVVMAELKKRGVFYLDSRTTADSIAETVAREYDVPAAQRDVFLDHEENAQMVGSSLQAVEDIARRTGSAIAIGHPKDVTLDRLEAWLPTVEARGFRLVPLSKVIAFRTQALQARLAHWDSGGAAVGRQKD